MHLTTHELKYGIINKLIRDHLVKWGQKFFLWFYVLLEFRTVAYM